MTDTSGHGFEAEPLKGGEADGGVSKEKSCAGKLGLLHLTGWRTAAFLLSLFLCMAVVFAFSFILPCPVRPQYLSTWSLKVPDAAVYDFLDFEDANKDKVLDVIFMYKGAEASRNTCMSEDLSPPCLVLLAVDGTDGKTLWKRPLAAEFDWVECGVKGIGYKGTGCLVAHADNLTAIDKQTGGIVWQQSRSSVMNGNLPLISVPDLDSDGAEDFAVLSYNPEAPSFTPIPTELVFFSGKSGDQIGSRVDIDLNGVFDHLQFKMASEASYLLLLTDSGLSAVSLRWLAARARTGLESALKKENSWEDKADSHTGLIPLYQSDSLKRVLVVHGGSSPSLLVQTDSSVSLLHTDKLKITWTTNTSTLLSVPTFGQFDKDGIPDIMIEEDLGNETKRVMILSGGSGDVLWEVNLLSWMQSPRPASVLTLNTYSVFMLWGQSHGNETMHSSFLLHPRYSQLLLERRNPVQNIISFKATLLERGRHACYLVLTGPDGRQHAESGGTEPVVLTKRKIKDDVSESGVLGVAADEPISKDTEESVKEAFNRLRFSDALF
ncbi:protein FAM234A-like [Myxocyprinus asiaticus]|uniref:protein FAM234A-like n=1 Tax=Myxocyprinus asiaticus TaxID=70543 RepID=UPI00222236E6|nr:protein FAM234A-like [Myxocyprinus asiaticus]XP_051543378.1 protein FAM234A-like [Myxocyprinus asiaticus]XP_051543379.1 protein FAM234A-like [Myxocyprinus asiaticus]XP_051543380.1 protein FAM234A-like [Myxocyprinus asiaticus]